ncbi:Autotransporter domain-containing protein [Hyphomicrobium sp. 1Nfss2.1]|uniref:autotransporter outer membrane beta-barrel domain-containing protein n=1 Tax=Hyphomicrobium sp. 1Nfss2.1 TaxID=3413936 RepID=UPI003C7DFEBE
MRRPSGLTRTTAEAGAARIAIYGWLLALPLAAASMPAVAQTVPPAAPCNQISGISGAIVTCTGNISSGVELSNGSGPFEVLNINNLTSAIVPAAGVTGVLFTSNGPVSVNIDTPFAIYATDANGIFAASTAGAVTIGSTIDITTSGSGAIGIQGSAQAALLTIMSSGDITTSGNNAFGIAAGTILGDATIISTGNISTSGTFSAGINVGTIGASGTTQGAITIFSSGSIATTGTSAIGINAASVEGSIAITSLGDITVSGEGSVGINAQTNGDVQIISIGDISTAGERAVAIFAETSGSAIVANYGSISTSADNAVGIDVDAQGGAVVRSTGNITTRGDHAAGINVTADGDAGVVSTGNITTTGTASDGISVTSDTGTALVMSSGNISATGTGSAGIYVAGYTSALVMNYGTVVGGACCAGIMMDSANYNMLLNHGTITAGLSDFAIDLMAPTNSVDNFGTITGDIRLFDGFDPTGSFNNHASGVVNSGGSITAAFFTNDGTLAPGGSGPIQDTLIGDPASSVSTQFIQGSTGVLAIDVDGAHATSDRIGVVGAAELAGTVDVTVTSLPATAAQSFLIVATNDGVTNNGLSVTASPVLHATLSYPNPNDVVLGIAVDFVTGPLNGNQRAIARALDRIFGAGGGGVTPVLLGLLNVDGIEDYRNALDQLSPQVYSDAQIAALYSNLAFTSSLMSCKVNGTDAASIIREGQCLWAGASARFLDAGTTSQQIGFSETAGLFTAGAQVALDDVWRLGMAAGYQSSNITTPTGASSDGALGQAGVALKYNSGPLLLAGAITGGAGQYDTQRVMAFGGFSGTTESTQDLSLLSGTLRAAYVFGDPSLYVKPSLDLSLTYLSLGDFAEHGTTGSEMTISGNDQTIFQLAPTVEAGTQFWLGNGTLVRPLVRGGAVWYANPDMTLTASFADAPVLSDGSSVGGFSILTKMDEVMGVVGAGVDVISGTDAVLRFSYDAQLGSTTEIHTVGLKGSAKF